MSIVEDFQTRSGTWVMSVKNGKTQHITKGYKTWNHINTRCKVGGRAQAKQPSYVGCYTAGHFRNFQTFMEWYTVQVGYGVPGYQIDKDILYHNNKCYCEDTCVLVPQALNCFLLNHARARGKYPQGVTWHVAGNAYSAGLNIEGKKLHLGLFPTIEAAARAYKIAKEAEAYRWYKRLWDKEFIVDERVTERMRTWEHVCDWKPS